MTATFILGGARSGKSWRAQSLAETAGPRRTYIATAEPFDAEMRDRIMRHQSDRGEGWTTVDAPLDLSQAIELCGSEQIILVDCLTLWLNNLLYHKRNIEIETKALIETIEHSSATIFLVSNEVGMGLVPENPLGRSFRDSQGRLNQALAQACDRVEFMAAGLPLVLKG